MALESLQTSIEVKGEGMPKPVTSFSYLPLPEKGTPFISNSSGPSLPACSPTVCSNLKEAKYHTPTPVQMQTIPAALLGRDVLVCATTGSGKSKLVSLSACHCNIVAC